MNCGRCKKEFIEEEFENHVCTPRATEIQEIGIDYILKGKTNENGDLVWMVKGLNGILYRLVECIHNPPHPNTDPTTFDSEKNRHKLYRTCVKILST